MDWPRQCPGDQRTELAGSHRGRCGCLQPLRIQSQALRGLSHFRPLLEPSPTRRAPWKCTPPPGTRGLVEGLFFLSSHSHPTQSPRYQAVRQLCVANLDRLLGCLWAAISGKASVESEKFNRCATVSSTVWDCAPAEGQKVEPSKAGPTACPWGREMVQGEKDAGSRDLHWDRQQRGCGVRLQAPEARARPGRWKLLPPVLPR